MFENDKENELFGGGNDLDLGSDFTNVFDESMPIGDDFTADFAEVTAEEKTDADAVFSDMAPTAEFTAEPIADAETAPTKNSDVKAEEKVYRPHAWASFGTADAQAADYAACKKYGPMYR